MKRTDEEIDQLFQDAARKVEVPYQDHYWDEMEVLLPEKSNQKVFWWFFGVMFALLGFASTLFIFSLPNPSLEKSMQKTGAISETIFPEQVSNEQEEERTSNVSTIIAENSFQNSNAVERKLNSTASQERLVVEIIDVQAKSIEKGNRIQKGNSNVWNKILTNADEKENPILSIENQKRVSPFLDKFDSIEVPMEKERTFAVVEKSCEALAQKSQEQQEKEEGSDQLAQTLIKEDWSAKDTLRESNLIAENENNQASQTTPSVMTNKNQAQPQATSPSNYYIQAGVSFGQSYLKTPTNNLMTGITLGAGYQSIKAGIGYSMGLHATSSFVKNLEIIRESRVYGFGVTNYQQNLRYKQLTYLELPIRIHYTHQKNSFFVGFNPTYLVSTRMNFSEFKEVEMMNERTYYGQKIGLKSVGLEAMIGYQRKIKEKWFLNVNFGMAFLQQIEPNYFGYQAVPFPVKGQITLRRILIFKK